MSPSRLEAEWHPTKNLPLLFNSSLMVSKKYWWVCSKNHEWEAALKNRKNGSKCPVCVNQKVLAGFNDLATLIPELAIEWHPTKNGELLPIHITAKTNKKVWWLGKCNHEWEAAVHSRSTGVNCPICAGQKILVGFNDLATTFPKLAVEWHPIKNGTLTAEQVLAGTNSKKVWWLGACGHEWENTPSNRSGKGQGCPVCIGRKVLPGFNDLASQYPDLALEWHPTKNGILTPEEIYMTSYKKVWWKCIDNHEWSISPSNRIVKASRCPICFNNQVLVGFNDLTTTHPSLAAEWHPIKNGTLKPQEFTAGSNKKVWWMDSFSHEWTTSLSKRTREGQNCPVCSNNKILVGFNDLATINPLLASEWHPTKNGTLTPDRVISVSNSKHWWKCKIGHEWESSPYARLKLQSGCLVCINQKTLVGFNDLATINPLIASEWHPTKNGTLTPQLFTSGSGVKIWWLGVCGHEWKTSVASRSSGSGCRKCTNIVSKAEMEIQKFLEGLGLTVEGSNRSILGGKKEIDLWIPEKKVGIEFNGIYWHTEKRRGTDAHHNKYLAAQKAGIKLIQIWEDEWNQKPEVVKRILAEKLGVAEKLLAEETNVITVTKLQAEKFLNENHLQGYAEGTHYLGLVNKGDIETLRAVMVLDEEPGTDGKVLYITRYATSAIVTNGFAKLLNHATNIYNPESFTATADHCEANAELYENNGFIVEKVLPPDYMYVVKNERKDKSEYPLERFRDDPKLLWEEGRTERELADLNGLDRIWDAGKIRYRLIV